MWPSGQADQAWTKLIHEVAHRNLPHALKTILKWNYTYRHQYCVSLQLKQVHNLVTAVHEPCGHQMPYFWYNNTHLSTVQFMDCINTEMQLVDRCAGMVFSIPNSARFHMIIPIPKPIYSRNLHIVKPSPIPELFFKTQFPFLPIVIPAALPNQIISNLIMWMLISILCSASHVKWVYISECVQLPIIPMQCNAMKWVSRN